MPKIMSVDQMDARINEVIELLTAAVPGADIKVDEMPLHGQPTAYVWANDMDGVVINGVDDDEAVYATCDEHGDTRRTFVSASDAVRAVLWMAEPAEKIAA